MLIITKSVYQSSGVPGLDGTTKSRDFQRYRYDIILLVIIFIPEIEVIFFLTSLSASKDLTSILKACQSNYPDQLILNIIKVELL